VPSEQEFAYEPERRMHPLAPARTTKGHRREIKTDLRCEDAFSSNVGWPARQCADKPENKQDDEHQAENAAHARRAISAMGVVAASAAQQENQKDNQKNREHGASPLSSTRFSAFKR
jgi:hypothetical protein